MADEKKPFIKRFVGLFSLSEVKFLGTQKNVATGVIVLVLFVIAGVVLAYLFLWSIIALIINFSLVYITALRLYLVYTHKRPLVPYGVGLIVAVGITLLVGSIAP